MTQLDPYSDALAPLRAYALRLPSGKDGKRLSPRTLWRWANEGIEGVRLRTEWIGRSRFTRDRWVCEFLVAVSAAKERKIRPPLTSARTREDVVAGVAVEARR